MRGVGPRGDWRCRDEKGPVPDEVVKGGREDLCVVLAEAQRGDALGVRLVKLPQALSSRHVPHLCASRARQLRTRGAMAGSEASRGGRERKRSRDDIKCRGKIKSRSTNLNLPLLRAAGEHLRVACKRQRKNGRVHHHDALLGLKRQVLAQFSSLGVPHFDKAVDGPRDEREAVGRERGALVVRLFAKLRGCGKGRKEVRRMGQGPGGRGWQRRGARLRLL